jgi:hypothetical protein
MDSGLIPSSQSVSGSPLEDPSAFRLVRTLWVVNDENLGTCRLSTAAIDDSSDGTPMSVILEPFMGDRTVKDLANDNQPFVVGWTYSQLAIIGLEVQPDPERGTDGNDVAHGFLAGKKTGSLKKKMCRAAQWKVPENTPQRPCPGSQT